MRGCSAAYPRGVVLRRSPATSKPALLSLFEDLLELGAGPVVGDGLAERRQPRARTS